MTSRPDGTPPEGGTTNIWDPVTERVEELGREYTFRMPPAAEFVRLAPKIGEFLESQQEEEIELTVGDPRLPGMVKLFQDVIAVVVTDFGGDRSAVAELPIQPLMTLGSVALKRFVNAQQYMDEQKKRLPAAPSGEPSGP